MSKIESIIDIKLAALFLQKNLMGRNREVVESAERELAQLVDRFYEENKDFVTLDQYQAALHDYDYFLVIIEMALEHYKTQSSQEESRSAVTRPD